MCRKQNIIESTSSHFYISDGFKTNMTSIDFEVLKIRKGGRTMEERFLNVDDVVRILGISKSAAYKVMRQMNVELEKKGFITIRGKVSRKYLEERFYGMTEKD